MDLLSGAASDLAASLNISGISSQIYPLVGWLYHGWPGLFTLFFMLGLVLGFADYFTGRMQFVGMNSKTISDNRQKYRRENERAAPYSALAALDSPPRQVTLKRHLYHSANLLINGFLLIALPLLGLAVLVQTWGETIIRQQRGLPPLTLAEYYLMSPANLFGAAWIFAGIAAGWGIARLLGFWTLQDWFARQNTRVNTLITQSRNKTASRTGELTDVRQMSFGERPEFNPLSWVSAARQQDAVFLGLDEAKQPIFLPRSVWKETNIQILGAPGNGKSIMATNALLQCAAFGDAVIYFDPKGDRFAPQVLHQHCKNFTLVDLRQGKPAQINPFMGLTPDELQKLLVAGFSLAETGDMADVYRVSEQKAAKLIAKQLPHGADVQQLLRAAHALPKDLKDNCKNLLNKLENLAELTAIQTAEGVDIAKVLREGGCLYIIGSTDDENVIRLQKMLFARCIQLVNARDDLEEHTHASIMIDELKYLLSAYVLNALGTVRSKGCNLALAHQSLGDFGQCGQGLDPEFVRTCVLDNTPIRWFYRASNYESAMWASQQTGEIQVDSERRRVAAEQGNTELVESETYLQKQTRHLFDTNMIQNMPKGFAVLVGLGVAKQAFTCPIAVTLAPIALQESPALRTEDPLSDFYPDYYADVPPEAENAAETHTARFTPDKTEAPDQFKELY